MILRLIKGTVTFTAGVVLALVVLEIFLRGGEIILPSITMLESKIGSIMKSDAEVVVIKDGLYLGKTNSYGYLGPDYPRDRRPGVTRIALVGDSYVEGMHIFDRHHFRSVIERELKQKTGEGVEVLNFGRSGFHLSDMYCYDVNFVSQFKPDIVLYFIHTGNMNIVGRPLGPYCYLDGDSLRINYDFAQSGAFVGRQRSGWLRGRFSVLAMASNCAINAERGLAWSIIFDKFYFGKLPGSPAIEGDMSASAETLSAVDRAILAKLSDQTDRGGYPRIAIVDMGLPAEVEEFIRGSHLDLLDPEPALKELEKKGINPHYWKATKRLGHWNHEANIAVGEYLAEALRPWVGSKVRPTH